MESVKHCIYPFSNFVIGSRGHVSPCNMLCGKYSYGNLADVAESYCNSIPKLLNSDNALAFRKSIIDGSYRYCANNCFMLTKEDVNVTYQAMPHQYRRYIDQKIYRLEISDIKYMTIAFDKICNLSCECCRLERFQPTDDNKAEYIKLYRAASFMARYVEMIDTSLLGDVFASPYGLQFLLSLGTPDYKNVTRIRIITNGLLLTPSMWKSLQMIHSKVELVRISVDAAKPDTYRRIRGTDKFHLLCENLEYLSKQPELKGKIILNFIIQKDNFMELYWMYKLAAKYNARANLQYLSNWGTYSDEVYNAKAVHRKSHPYYSRFVDILNILPPKLILKCNTLHHELSQDKS